LIDMAIAESLLLPAFVWKQAFEALFEDDFLPAGKRLAMPLQVHWGDCDSYCPRPDQNVVMGCADDAELHVYRGVGHALHWEQPAEFARHLGVFARRVFGDVERG
jgi:pimeloyl-ACP methyl ester carboxylesterase